MRPLALVFLLLACAGHPPARPLLALDSGHDAASPGALSATGRYEWAYNEEMSARIERELRERGFSVVRTRGSASPLPSGERAARANASGAALLLSVHHDSVKEVDLVPQRTGDAARSAESRVARGFSLHVRGDRPEAVRIAEAIGAALVAAGFTPTPYHLDEFPALDLARGIYDRRHLAILNGAEVPAVLLECGFIVHPEEERALHDAPTAQRFARAVADGISAALELPIRSRPHS